MALTEASAFKDGSIVNNDIKSDAAIAKTKLASLDVVNADINASAAIAGTKINPNFGSQYIETTGHAIVSRLRIEGANIPKIEFTDADDNPDYSINVNNGQFNIIDATNNATRFRINTDGHVDVAGNLDVGAGLDVTGDITVSGTCTATTFSGSGASLTNLPSSALTGALPAIDGSNLTGISAAVPAVEVARLSSNQTVSNSSYQTKLTLNITPSTSGTALLVQMNGSAASARDSDGSVKQIQVRLNRGSTTLVTYTTTSTSSSQSLNLHFPLKDTSSHGGNQVTYTIQARFTGGGDEDPVLRAGTSIVVQEIV